MTMHRFIQLISAMALVVLLSIGTARAAQPAPDIAEPFRDYYTRHQGIRVLGYPLTELVEADGYIAQYFEKGRIEDHRRDTTAPRWQFMYGRLTAELMERDPQGSVSGTTLTYSDLRAASDPLNRRLAPPGFRDRSFHRTSGAISPVPICSPAAGCTTLVYR